MSALLFLETTLTAVAIYLVFQLFIAPRLNPLKDIAGPPLRSLFDSHLLAVLNPKISARIHALYTQKYGRSIRIRGIGPWEDRLLTLDPVSLSHVLKNDTIYEKPWQTRQLITNMLGCGMFSAEGQMHRRQRRVSNPAFSIQNMRALVPLVYHKGSELKVRWRDSMPKGATETAVIDVCHWVSRATFDVIGMAGFDYEFNSIRDETNELFCAYREMFEVAISQGNMLGTMISLYAPILDTIFPSKTVKTVRRCQAVIKRVTGELVKEKKRKIEDSEKIGSIYGGKDLLSLLLKSNRATDLPPAQRISDDDIFHNVNTFMFVGSDTSSLTVTWTLYLLAQHPALQTRLRDELIEVMPTGSELTEDEIQSLYDVLSNLPFLHNVVRESLRLIPPVHSSIRIAMQDDVIPTQYPVHGRDGSPKQDHSVHVAKGTVVHVAIEAFNLDKEVWGEDAWEFNPDRWDNLPQLALEQPGLYSNLLSFSAGPRACIGMRFSIIEIKTFLSILLANFVFSETDATIFRANVVFTRPYVQGRYKDGSQLPLRVSPFVR
ncbi:cytochrome-450 hydroxylase [Mycena floridula]|nr:cytochrome-450 hydroxylase [Mycena floridula]